VAEDDGIVASGQNPYAPTSGLDKEATNMPLFI
jgi:hypothetical protein